MTDKTEEYRLRRECYLSGQMTEAELQDHLQEPEFAAWWDAQGTPTPVPTEGETMNPDKSLRIAAERYLTAVKKLGEESGYNRLTYFEAPISKMPTVEMSTEATSRWVELNNAGVALRAAMSICDALPSDVSALVIAARIVAYEDQGPEALRDLDRAVEAFAERVPWDDEDEIDREEDRVRAALNAEGK